MSCDMTVWHASMACVADWPGCGRGLSALAQTVTERQEVELWLGVLIGVLLVAALVGWLIRRHALRNAESGGQVPPFSLAVLRQMRQAGQITDEEFNRARRYLIAQMPGLHDADGPDRREAAAGEGADSAPTQSPTDARDAPGEAPRNEKPDQPGDGPPASPAGR
jgi:hypothetical protein